MSNTLCRWVSLKLSKPPTEYLLEHEKQIIDEHVEECHHCRELKELSAAMNSWGKLTPPAVSPFVERKIITAALEGRMPGTMKEPFWTRRFSPLFVAAGAVVAAIIAVLFLYSGGDAPANTADPAQAVGDLNPDAKGAIAGRTADEVAANVYNFVSFEKSKPVELMRDDKVWGSERAIVNVQVVSNELTRIELIKGKIVAKVTKRQKGEKFEVVGPSGTVIVVGTVFSVEVDEVGIQHVRVLEGKVKVKERSSGTVTSVSRNRQFTVGSADAIAASDVALESDRELMAPLSSDAGEKVVEAKSKDRKSHSASVPRVSRKRPASNAAELASQAIDEKRLVEAKQHINTVRLSSQNQDVPGLYARLARAYRQQKNYAAARGTYEQLIREYSNSNAARNARVALAQLELNALGNPQAALRYFNDYLETVPGGYLAEAAWIGKARSQLRLGNNRELLQTSNSYLSNYANGSFAAEMLLYRGNVRAQNGNCALAQKDYRAIMAQWPNSKKAKEAQQRLSACGAN